MKKEEVADKKESDSFIVKDFLLIPNNKRVGLRSDVVFKGNKIYLLTGEPIGYIDKGGKLIFEEGYKQKLRKDFGDYYKEFNIEEPVIVSKDTIEKEEIIKEDKSKKQEENKVPEKNIKEEDMIEQIEETTNRKITACTKIMDDALLNEFPSYTKGEFNDIFITYCEDTDTFQVEGVYRAEDGSIKTKPLSEMRQSKSIKEDITEIANDGKEIKTTKTKAVIQFKENMNENTSIAVDIKNGGRINVKQLEEKTDKNGNITYIARDVNTKSQRPSEKELEDAIDKEKNDRLDEVTSEATEIITLEDGREVTYQEMAEKFHVSKDEFAKYYEQADGSPEQRLEEVEKIFEEQYRGPNMKR